MVYRPVNIMCILSVPFATKANAMSCSSRTNTPAPKLRNLLLMSVVRRKRLTFRLTGHRGRKNSIGPLFVLLTMTIEASMLEPPLANAKGRKTHSAILPDVVLWKSQKINRCFIPSTRNGYRIRFEVSKLDSPSPKTETRGGLSPTARPGF